MQIEPETEIRLILTIPCNKPFQTQIARALVRDVDGFPLDQQRYDQLVESLDDGLSTYVIRFFSEEEQGKLDSCAPDIVLADHPDNL